MMMTMTKVSADYCWYFTIDKLFSPLFKSILFAQSKLERSERSRVEVLEWEKRFSISWIKSTLCEYYEDTRASRDRYTRDGSNNEKSKWKKKKIVESLTFVDIYTRSCGDYESNLKLLSALLSVRSIRRLNNSQTHKITGNFGEIYLEIEWIYSIWFTENCFNFLPFLSKQRRSF